MTYCMIYYRDIFDKTYIDALIKSIGFDLDELRKDSKTETLLVIREAFKLSPFREEIEEDKKAYVVEGRRDLYDEAPHRKLFHRKNDGSF